MGVAQQRHALSFFAQSAGLFDGHEGLAAARSPADLDTLEQTDGVEDDGLAFGEDVGGVLVLQGAGDDVALRQAATAQRDLQLVDAGAGQQGPVDLVFVGDVSQASTSVERSSRSITFQRGHSGVRSLGGLENSAGR